MAKYNIKLPMNTLYNNILQLIDARIYLFQRQITESQPSDFDIEAFILSLALGFAGERKSIGRRIHETADLRSELDEDVHYASSVL